jgi:hypothetical protein
MAIDNFPLIAGLPSEQSDLSLFFIIAPSNAKLGELRCHAISSTRTVRPSLMDL